MGPANKMGPENRDSRNGGVAGMLESGKIRRKLEKNNVTVAIPAVGISCPHVQKQI